MENIHQGHREKMRQRFLKSGLEGFAEHEALRNGDRERLLPEI